MVRPSGLHSVDPRVDPVSRLRFLDAEGAKPAMRAAKLRSFEALGGRAGARLLDVGCGTGDDARALARRGGPQGRIAAIDADPMMSAGAQRHSPDGPGTVRLR